MLGRNDKMDVLDRLNVTIESKFLEEACVLAAKEEQIPEWLKPKFLYDLKNDWGILETNIELALVALKQVVENKDLLMLAKILYYILKLKGSDYEQAFKELKLPDIPGNDEANIGYNCVSLFPAIALTRKACEHLVSNGISKEMAKVSMRGVSGSFTAATKRKGYPSFNPYFTWALYYVGARIIRLENFEFQVVPNCMHPIRVYKNKDGQLKTLMDGVKIHKSGFLLNSAGCDDDDGAFDANVNETDEFFEGYLVNEKTHRVENKSTRLSKTDWVEVTRPGNASIEMHIPRGSKIDYETCQSNFNSARQLFSKIFPEYDFKIFTINTWLLAPELSEILKPGSNILAFQKMFNTYPLHGKGLEVFNFVFNTMYESINDVDFESLSEETSLMRGIKNLYKDGGYIHEYGGYFLF